MEQITIDFKNAFDCSKKESRRFVALAMYVWFVLWMIKKHTRPQVYEGHLLEVLNGQHIILKARDW